MLMVDKMEETTGKEQLSYAATCLEKDKGYVIGLPAVYFIGGILKGQLSRGETVGASTAKTLKMSIEDHGNMKLCRRLRKEYDQELIRLELIAIDKIRDPFNRALAEFYGAAPPWGVEDILQKYPDSK